MIYNPKKSLCSVQLYGKRSTHNHAQAFQHNHIQSSAEQAPFSEAGFILIYKTSGATPSFCVAPEACIRFRTAYTPSIYPDKSAAYFTIFSNYRQKSQCSDRLNGRLYYRFSSCFDICSLLSLSLFTCFFFSACSCPCFRFFSGDSLLLFFCTCPCLGFSSFSGSSLTLFFRTHSRLGLSSFSGNPLTLFFLCTHSRFSLSFFLLNPVSMLSKRFCVSISTLEIDQFIFVIINIKSPVCYLAQF